MKRRRWGCLVVLVVVVLGALVLGSGALRPEPAAPELGTRRERHPAPAADVQFTVGGVVVDGDENGVPGVPLRIATTDGAATWFTETGPDGRFALRGVSSLLVVEPGIETVPASRIVMRPRTDLVFRVAVSCPVEARVWSDQSEALAGATVTITMDGGPLDRGQWEATTNAAGLAMFPALPCGPATQAAEAPGHHSEVGPFETAEGATWFELSPVDDGRVRIFGVVHAGGVPVPGVALGAVPAERLRDGMSGQDGRYSMLVAGPGPSMLIASHPEHQIELDSLLVPPGVTEWEHDVELEPIRKVKVYCAGLRDDGCQDLPLVMCTEPWAPGALPCTEEGGVMTCRCPLGEAAVRGGGESVLVGPDEDEAWLDFRAPGGISGRVMVDGEPAPCTLEVVRWSLELAGGGGLRLHACESSGEFFIPSLQEGSWRVVVRSVGLETAVGPIDVGREVVDVGLVEITGGVRLSGRVAWEDDETPVAGVSVAAVEIDALADGAAPPVGTAVTGEDGGFSILGLEPGRYQVLLPRDPGGAQVVELDDEDVYVELWREGGSGLALGRDEQDRLIVAEGDAEGWLLPGDRLERVEVGGVDLLGMLPRYGDAVGETVLGMVGWPGLTVVVERDGETIEVGADP